MNAPTKDTRRSGTWICIATAAVAAVVYFAARGLLENPALRPPLRTVIALVPVPFFLFFLLTELRLMRRLDELERHIQLEALALAFPAVLLLLLTLGLVELATPLSPADWSYRHVWIYCLGFYGIGVAVARRRYQ